MPRLRCGDGDIAAGKVGRRAAGRGARLAAGSGQHRLSRSRSRACMGLGSPAATRQRAGGRQNGCLGPAARKKGHDTGWDLARARCPHRCMPASQTQHSSPLASGGAASQAGRLAGWPGGHTAVQELCTVPQLGSQGLLTRECRRLWAPIPAAARDPCSATSRPVGVAATLRTKALWQEQRGMLCHARQRPTNPNPQLTSGSPRAPRAGPCRGAGKTAASESETEAKNRGSWRAAEAHACIPTPHHARGCAAAPPLRDAGTRASFNGMN